MSADPSPVPHRPDERFDEFLLAAAEHLPDHPAVVEYVDGRVRATTFRELRAAADRYAADLDRYGLDVGDRVMVVSDNTRDAIALLLACSSRGLPFVPVSPEMPAERRAAIAELAEPALCLTAGGAPAAEPGPAAAPGHGWFGPGGVDVPTPPAPRARRRWAVTPTDTAYIIFTSGTTGRPKGVVMSHRAVVSFYRGMLAENIVGPGDRVASTSPLQFDFSLLDIGLALGSGAAVTPVPRALLRWPTRFVKVLRATRATHVNGVPSIWRQALRHIPDQVAALTDLRGVLFCGEDFPLPELRHLQRLRPQARLVNCYGATESMAASFADVPNPLPAELDRLSIGRGHVGAELLVVDERGRTVEEPGTVGEMHLRSPALFSGYWGDPEATAAALVPDPVEPRSGQRVLRTGDLAYRGADGELRFCGRVDSQVQIRGNRVELAEVQRRLLEFPGVAEAAAVVVAPPDREPELAAFVVLADDAPPVDESAILAFCLKSMPAYMAPSRMRVTDALPVNQNGKTDHRRLLAALGSD
ncbi:amino acid adenylation domain-containing protein [Micromonospora sp. WMMD882]|uniref:amino acid adenylation domain-containing protein n=1 Tax=Micromonospora sp. WMMD882 TaxID=3015151 RepID=UPI00248CCA42|nr:amino acid adenylation domain-containing protein [Micromonospora sp. WMMD882]WBB78721.1 amino acid adenylation domain-containing protein [Micromonospora sp. WMMD882]